MKKFIKHFLAVIVASIIFCFSALPVSAYTTVTFEIPFNHYNNSSVDENTSLSIFNNIYANQSIIDLGYTSENSTLSFYQENDSYRFYLQKIEKFIEVGDGIILNVSDRIRFIASSFSDINTIADTVFTETYLKFNNSSSYVNLPCYVPNSNTYYLCKIRSVYPSTISVSDVPDNSKPLCFYYNYMPAYNPIISPLYQAVYSLSIEKDEFIKWLIDNKKYVEIADSLVENRVSGFVDIFQRYGANTKAFAYNVKQFFEFIGIGQTVSDYGAVLEKTRSLYREYQQYVRQQLIDHYNNKVKDTLNIKPVTDDNNTNLITDTDSDTVVIRLLRDILRALIALPVNIGDLMQTLVVRVDGLDNTVNITSESGLPDFASLWTYNSNDFDDDLNNFSSDIALAQQLPVSYLTNINENPLMPEKMLNDKDNLTVNIPNMSGFTVSDDGKSFSTQTTSYTISSNDYPWLDPLVKKIKRFSGILLILGYLVSLRYRLPEIVRGE